MYECQGLPLPVTRIIAILGSHWMTTRIKVEGNLRLFSPLNNLIKILLGGSAARRGEPSPHLGVIRKLREGQIWSNSEVIDDEGEERAG